ncbi:ribosome silencing factor [Enterovibrio norvegicus]|uniref:Ribosomal silencing factor RsfS n=2 Tax=Enterovibrio norvegicus TaxID=188144 RepID=A0A1I5QM46_9GAMM|nr:ribosome silencing factor [Enterovibrio norvegicus]MCC4799984.1 ribosome silencing factor [Enterovibrio norvegicus]OEE44401.1 ribosome silencing factor [Enterovibrio norvegicus]OEF55029.1 ribosome silencing factor [Enterovibrio norvegicus]OEF65086.1 ribosome silencing factor [Enterovibrio norvegicus]PMH64944.1 ribosome silencing factor [Enterovibrio norvegicus]
MLPEQLQHFVVDKADDMKAVDIVILDVREKSSITDFMVLCTGNSKRHVSSIAEHVADEANAANINTLGMEGQNEGEWVVLDLGDVMLHIMQDEQRQTYELEKLWN